MNVPIAASERAGLPAEEDRRRDDEDVEERDAAGVGAFDRHREALREHRAASSAASPSRVPVECDSLANETAAHASVSAPAVQTGTSTASSRGGRPARVLTLRVLPAELTERVAGGLARIAAEGADRESRERENCVEAWFPLKHLRAFPRGDEART